MTTKDVTSQWNYGSNITDYNRDFMVMLITLPCSGLKVFLMTCMFSFVTCIKELANCFL